MNHQVVETALTRNPAHVSPNTDGSPDDELPHSVEVQGSEGGVEEMFRTRYDLKLPKSTKKE